MFIIDPAGLSLPITNTKSLSKAEVTAAPLKDNEEVVLKLVKISTLAATNVTIPPINNAAIVFFPITSGFFAVLPIVLINNTH